MEFLGYRRPDGQVGVRNRLAIIPSVICSARVVQQIAAAVPGSIPLVHQHGCSQVGDDVDLTFETLAGLGKNPNVGAALVVSLGCETLEARRLAEEIAKTGKPVEFAGIQEMGGTLRTIEEGIRLAQMMQADLERQKPEPCHLSEVLVALECGTPDATTGALSNPAVGVVAQRLLEAGGRLLFSEVPDVLDADLLAERAADAPTADQLRSLVQRWDEMMTQRGVDLDEVLKGLGPDRAQRARAALSKTGSGPIQGLVGFSQTPPREGLFMMETPENDVESVTGMVSGGAAVVLFTAGLGNPIGSPVAPVIKITANRETARLFADHVDVDGSDLEAGSGVEELGRRVMESLLAVAGGQETKAEILGHDELALNRIGPTV